MDEQKSPVEALIEKGEQYGKTTIELLKLKTIDKSADVASNLVSWLVIIALALIFFLVLNLGIGFWLGHLLGQLYLGFLILAAFYGVLTLLFIIFRKAWLKRPVNNSIINQIID